MSEPLRPFTSRQLEILELVARGLSPAAIAGQLRVAHRTVRSHIAQIALLLPALPGERSAYQRVLRYAVRRRFGLETAEVKRAS